MKRALIIATFGTTHQDAIERDFMPVVAYLKEQHPELEISVAFTSRMVIRAIKTRENKQIDNEIEAVQRLIDKGYDYDEIYIQPLHIISGFEYEKLTALKDKGVHVGEALLSDKKDIQRFVEEIKGICSEPTFFVGHGSHHPRDDMYRFLECHMRKENLPMAVSTLEGALKREDGVAFFNTLGIKTIFLAPLLLLAGDHAKNDIAGDEDSYKTYLQSLGFRVKTTEQGLGSLAFVQKMYGEKCRRLLERACLCEN